MSRLLKKMKSENWILTLIWDLILKILDINAIFEQIPEIDFFRDFFFTK